MVGDSAVAVVADTWWEAKKALDAMPIEWDQGPNAKVSSATIADTLKEGLDAEQAFVRTNIGDAKGTFAGATKKVEAVYAYPFQNHAPMEPMNATAKYTADKCEVWVPTQNGEAAFAATLAASGLPADKCEVYKINLGGGFGRRGAFHDYVTQAVRIAKQVPGTPVKLLWSREEDMVQGRYHPVMQAKMRGGLDANGNLVALHMRLSGQSILSAVFPQNLQDGRDNATFQGLDPSGDFTLGYTVPNLLIDHAMRNTHVPPGFWRGVNINQNAIFLECFMDELALAAGVDALEFRRKLMSKHPKHLAVLNAVADRAGWGKPAPQGVYRGLAHMMAFSSYVAACAEVSVTGNKVKVQRIVCATDPGYAVNPAQIERQIAGSFVYGLSAVFMEECTVKNGAIEQTNFNTYDSMKIAQMPKVESIIMPSGGFWGGVGEPTICVAAPAVLNAMARATGKRIRTFPLKNHGYQMV
jgi:isoquinoline 1-oxidoreductase subunit beta